MLTLCLKVNWNKAEQTLEVRNIILKKKFEGSEINSPK